MNLGIIAHNSKKVLIEDFCIAYKNILAKHEVYATGTTGRRIEDATGLHVHKFLAGHLGGVQQIATQIESNQMDLVIFLREPMLNSQPHNDDFHTISTLCDIHNIPIASNLASAELLIKSLERGDLNWRELYKH